MYTYVNLLLALLYQLKKIFLKVWWIDESVIARKANTNACYFDENMFIMVSWQKNSLHWAVSRLMCMLKNSNLCI